MIERFYLPPVLLSELEDGLVLIEDGHHRCFAYWLAGRDKLEKGEYILLQKEFSYRPTFGNISTIDAGIGDDMDVKKEEIITAAAKKEKAAR